MISVGTGKFFAYFLTFTRIGEDALWGMGGRGEPCARAQSWERAVF